MDVTKEYYNIRCNSSSEGPMSSYKYCARPRPIKYKYTRLKNIIFRGLECEHELISNNRYPFTIDKREDAYGAAPVFTKISDYKRKVYKK